MNRTIIERCWHMLEWNKEENGLMFEGELQVATMASDRCIVCSNRRNKDYSASFHLFFHPVKHGEESA